MFKKFWQATGNEKFVWRTIVGGCTFLSVFTLFTTEPPSAMVWAMGMLNGFLVYELLNTEFEEDEQ